ncbi:hypothetical protein BWI17_03700 [Betaproteobacteria bacterium GR16-43]|nr:hypothetical protein BWI17_03700 [Betaproteobacteria bacterium GR16-43]
MIPGYAWRCHYCDNGNAAGTSFCRLCRSKALASPAEVDAVRQGTPVPEDKFEIPTSPVLMVFWYFFASVAFIGGMLAKFAWSIWLNLGGLVALGIGCAGASLMSYIERSGAE